MLLGRLAGLPPGHVLSAREAAGWCGLSLPMVSKILKSLAREGIVASHRGVSGGYHLTRPAEQIPVAHVIRALEGPIAMVECAAHAGSCEQEPICPTRVSWARINREIESALERVPLSELIARPAPGPASLGVVAPPRTV
jgi:Rrf2 family protein